jgi:L-lactate dehydrogenase (cytochrome)
MMDRTVHSYEDARKMARKRLPWMVFDYIDGAAGSGEGEVFNRRAMAGIHLQSRVLRDVRHRDLSTTVFDQWAEVPFGIAPMGMCNLSAPNADVFLARQAAKSCVPIGVSTVASTDMETMLTLSEGHAWFQLYYSGDGSGTMALVERAKAAGYQTLVLTLDVPEVGRRPRELRRGFKMPFKIGASQFIDFALHPRWSISTLIHGRPEMANFQRDGFAFDRTESRAGADWETLSKVRDAWPGRLVAKGVVSVEDAVALKAAGVDAVQVSSHGGRQLDGGVPPILALKAIRDAVGPAYPLFYDSGVRSGEDVAKALQQGADFVLFGRAMQFAIAANGEEGLQQFWAGVSSDLSIAMAQMGHCDIASLKAR